MRFDYHTQYREGFALWRSPFDRNLYALLLLGLCALPWVITPFMLGELAYVFILCVASLGLMTLTGLTGQVTNIEHSFKKLALQLKNETRQAYGDPVKRILADPEKKCLLNAMIRKAIGKVIVKVAA